MLFFWSPSRYVLNCVYEYVSAATEQKEAKMFEQLEAAIAEKSALINQKLEEIQLEKRNLDQLVAYRDTLVQKQMERQRQQQAEQISWWRFWLCFRFEIIE